MTSMCSTTPDAITSVMLAGDAVLNLSHEPLKTVAGTPYVCLADGTVQLSSEPARVSWSSHIATALRPLLNDGIHRILIVADAESADANDVVQDLESQGVACVLCTLSDDCDADAFMDEEDAEAVAERLRQLGYI